MTPRIGTSRTWCDAASSVFQAVPRYFAVKSVALAPSGPALVDLMSNGDPLGARVAVEFADGVNRASLY